MHRYDPLWSLQENHTVASACRSGQLFVLAPVVSTEAHNTGEQPLLSILMDCMGYWFLSTLGRYNISTQHLAHCPIKFGWFKWLGKNGLESI